MNELIKAESDHQQYYKFGHLSIKQRYLEVICQAFTESSLIKKLPRAASAYQDHIISYIKRVILFCSTDYP